MLLPWSKRSTIALGANGLAIKHNNALPVVLATADDCYQNAKVMTDALIAVADTVEADAVEFVVSNHFVRYIVLPWQGGVVSRQDWIALAQHAFRKQFGAVAEQWDVRVSLAAYGQSVVACAIEQSLINSLQTIASEQGWQLAVIEPVLMTLMQTLTLQKEKVWVLIGEPERVLLATYIDGEWKSFAMINPPKGLEITQSHQLIKRLLAETTSDEHPTKVLAYVTPQLKGDWTSDAVTIDTVNIGAGTGTNSALWMLNI